MEGKEVCLEPVLSLGEAPEHPHLKARNTFVEFDGVVQPAPAPRFSLYAAAICGRESRNPAALDPYPVPPPTCASA